MTIGNIKTHDNWYTPDLIYKIAIGITGVIPELDVCADKDNRRCKNYFTKEQDALKLSWCLINKSVNTTNKYTSIKKVPVWCNPPGKYIQLMVNRAYDQWTVLDIDIVMLIPVNTITNKDFKKMWEDKDIDIFPLFGLRPRFLDKGKEPKFGSRNGYMILHFKKRHAS